MKKFFKNTANILLILVIAVCSFNLGHKEYKYYQAKKSYSNIKEIKPLVEDNTDEDTKLLQNSAAFNSLVISTSYVPPKKDTINEMKLEETNADYKMWLSIPNTNIDYPVVQGKDNDFYLHNNFYKDENPSGAIFMDYKNNLDTDKNLIIYGHNMKDGTMFCELNKYKETDDISNCKINIIKNNSELTYEVFSVFVTDEKFDNLKYSFKSTEEYINYLKYLKAKSISSNLSEDINYSSIITLYTCSYEFEGARTIVCAGLR